MGVWGGFDGMELDSGARYDPSTDTWTGISGIGAPIGRTGHSAIWTGSEMTVWGGESFGRGRFSSGGRYVIAPDAGQDVDQDGFTPCDGDCDDANAGVHPNAVETCDSLDT